VVGDRPEQHRKAVPRPSFDRCDEGDLVGGATVATGDGILLDGRTLYVVQNTMNQIAVIRVNGALTSSTIRTRITDSRFMVPTTIDEHGRRLYAVNAHFGAQPSSTDYEVLQLRKPPGR
jgi:hypothetical protein